jgi:hypothetical protein
MKLTFLNEFLEEQIYIDQPPGYMKKGKQDKVYKLKKTLYSMKQTPHAWNMRIDDYF